METITTNFNALQKRIDSEVSRAFTECKQAADEGRNYIWFTTDKDIQRDVRDLLESNHNICVPMYIPKHGSSYRQVEHWGERTEMKLKWY